MVLLVRGTHADVRADAPTVITETKIHWTDAGLMLDHRLRLLPSIKTASV